MSDTVFVGELWRKWTWCNIYNPKFSQMSRTPGDELCVVNLIHLYCTYLDFLTLHSCDFIDSPVPDDEQEKVSSHNYHVTHWWCCTATSLGCGVISDTQAFDWLSQWWKVELSYCYGFLGLSLSDAVTCHEAREVPEFRWIVFSHFGWNTRRTTKARAKRLWGRFSGIIFFTIHWFSSRYEDLFCLCLLNL